MKKVLAQAKQSVPNGRFWPCPSSILPGVHPKPLAVAVMIGAKGGAFYRCACGDNHFFTRHPSVDPRSVGYTAEQVIAMGYFPV